MHMSRHLEETRRTKFRKGTREEELRKDRKSKLKHRPAVTEHHGFDMWEDISLEDENAEGC